MPINLKKWYLTFLEKSKKNLLENIIYCFLITVSLLYGFIVRLKNLLYDRKIIKPFYSGKKVISIGNLSWAGTGKTTLTAYLHAKLSSQFKIAVIRRGYGRDEGKLLAETIKNVFSSPDRIEIIKKNSCDFDIFILDDGFQHRKLHRDLDIVIMGAREFKVRYRLIPACFFREPFKALNRADILILNYKDEFADLEKIKQTIKNKFGRLKIYSAGYKFKRFVDFDNKEVTPDFFKSKKIAALSGIGYPQGFLNKLRELRIHISKKIIYPDHYELGEKEFILLTRNLLQAGIENIIITSKDKYHLPKIEQRIKIFIMEIEIEIDHEQKLLEEILIRLKNVHAN